MKFQFIKDHSDRFQIRRMCRVLEVSPSGYYAWLHRPESNRVRENRRLVVEIKAIHKENRRVYGSPRIHAEHKEREIHVSENRVARLMRENAASVPSRRKSTRPPRTPIIITRWLPICLIETLRRTAPTKNGWRTLGLFPLVKAGCTWRPSWTFIPS